MDEKTPPRGPVAAPPTAQEGLDSLDREPQEAASPAEVGADPYDDLWDPNMDTRPERIRRTKARPPRPKGLARSKRRDEG